MRFLDSELSKYGLHDSSISKISVIDEGLLLFFEKGIYLVDNGKETELSNKCTIKITIDSFVPNNLYEHISINNFSKTGLKDIEFSAFCDEVNSGKQELVIDMDYYSEFAKSMLLKCFIGKNSIEVILTEIEKIEFIFNS